MIPTPRTRGSGGVIPRVLHKTLSLGQRSIWSYFFHRIKEAGSVDSSVPLTVTASHSEAVEWGLGTVS